MTEVDVVLTDWALALECAAFVWLLARRRSSGSQARVWFMVFFASIASAAAIGGAVHGFFTNEATLGHRILWPSTMIAIGLTALSGIRIGTALEFTGSTATIVNRAAGVLFAIYVVIVLWISNDFLVAILGYLPAVIFLALVFLIAYRREKRPAFMIGFLGVCTTLVASVVQQAKMNISVRYFDYNALYHVLQGIGMLMIFIAARESCRDQQPVA